jgi:hypothetical protein
MKKHHILLLVILAGIAAFLLRQTHGLKHAESQAQAELKLLRDAVRKSPGVATTASGGSSDLRPAAIDSAEFLSDLNFDPGSGDYRQSMLDFADKYEARISSAPLSKLKELCALIEKQYPLGQEKNKMARKAWFAIVGEATKSDPAWAFAKLEEASSLIEAPVGEVLGTFKRWSTMDGEAMNPAYASALEKWLDEAQTAGKIDAAHPLVNELRAGIAAAQGDFSAAVRQISQLPYTSQREAAVDYVSTLQTPEARLQAMQELSTALQSQNFTRVVRELANQHGFDAARKILNSASLAPEKHDLAAAGIASAAIGPETKQRAAWLLENLRSDDPQALAAFTGTWTEGNQADAANWLGTLPHGKRRDAALKGFIPVAARIDGATAMDWALTVSDPLLRNQLYNEAHAKWHETDAGQANEYRSRHRLDSEAVEAASK